MNHEVKMTEGPKKARLPRPSAARPAKTGERGAEQAKKLALAIADAALDKKALNVEIIDVTGKVDYADFVVVMSGRSDRQVSAIAQGIDERLREKEGVRAIAVEGIPQGAWVLMDYGDVIVHVFHQDTRGYYDLESLWIDAARIEVPNAE